MGILYVVATPIGNLDDITFRAVKILASVDLVLCEDTRRTGLLLDRLMPKDSPSEGLSLNHNVKLVSYYDEIEDKRIPEIIDWLENGKKIALVSDAGTPLISDPGFRLVRECIKRGITVESIPGPSAILAALTSSGLPPDKFMFLGYLPEKQTVRIKQLNILQSINRLIDVTYIFYCAPHKLSLTLEDMKSVFGDIEIVIARELTKRHEEMWKGSLSKAIIQFSEPKGEFVLLLYL